MSPADPAMTAAPLWTCVATCQVCGKELNRAVHVPAARKWSVELAAPLVAICDVKGHSTFSDCNFAPVLTWTQETPVVPSDAAAHALDWIGDKHEPEEA